MKKLFGLLFVSFGLFLLLKPVFASITVVDPQTTTIPAGRNGAYPLPYSETAQKGVIWYENGTETLIISTAFKGNAASFGWLIPVPAKPTVEKASDELFTSLNDLTQPRYSSQPGPMGMFGVGGISSGVRLEDKSGPVAPTIYEGKALDVFDMTTLSAKDDKGLRDWLSDHGYNYPADRDYIIKSYTDSDWYFVAVKVNSQNASSASGSLSEGHATPLKITFKTDRIIYPLKLSGPGIPTTAGSKVAAFSFEQGTENWIATLSIGKDQKSTQEPPPPPGFVSPQTKISLDATSAYHGKTSIKLSGTHLTGSESISATTAISNLKSGKSYTISAYVKSAGAQKGSVYLSTLGGVEEQSEKVLTSSINNDWKRLTLSFIAPTTSAAIRLNGQNFVDGEIVNIDAVQVEEGNQSSEFVDEVIPNVNKPVPVTNQDQVTVLLYVFADGKKELPGFTTSYAGWVSAKNVERLAFDSGGKDSWVKAKNKMYLTKLSRVMTPAAMTDDLIFRDSANNNPVNSDSTPDVDKLRLFGVIAAVLILEVAGITMFLLFKRKKRTATNVSE